MAFRRIIITLLCAMLALGMAAALAEEHGAHYAACTSPQVCQVGGESYDGTDVRHGGHTWATSSEGHWTACADCGAALSGVEAHLALCTNQGLCVVCGAAGPLRHPAEQADELVHDGQNHWWKCIHCGQPSAPIEAHYTNSGDPEGVCSKCGAVYGSQTAAPEPTEEPAEEPTEEPVEPTAAPTRKSAAKKATPTPKADGESFLSRFQAASDVAAAGSVLMGDVTTLTMEAGADSPCAILTIDQAGSREDGVTVSLLICRDQEGRKSFLHWQAAVLTADDLQSADAAVFVELARALIRALQPELSVQEAEEVLVALLRSGTDGALETEELPTATFGEDADGEIIGYLPLEDEEIFLVMRESGVELLVRKL